MRFHAVNHFARKMEISVPDDLLAGFLYLGRDDFADERFHFSLYFSSRIFLTLI